MEVTVTFRADPLSAGVVRIRATESPRTGTVFSFNSALGRERLCSHHEGLTEVTQGSQAASSGRRKTNSSIRN